MGWSANEYEMFENERTRPVRDLLNAVPVTDVRHAIDLGCGPGNSTEVVAARFPMASITGLDSSPNMIEAARRRLPQLPFDVCSVENWKPSEAYDLILANASLQWVPDHRKLLPKLVEQLAPGGTLAIQMPDNLDEPPHKIMREVAKSGPWVAQFNAAASVRVSIESPPWYHDLLRPFCSHVDIWRTPYYHPLVGGVDAVVNWFRGSGLRPFLQALDEGDQASFLERYRTAIMHFYPESSDGSLLLRFPRLFIVATV